MSLLRAKCPTCKANTAVALGPEYECHSCGRTFAAGLVRVPRAWGDGGEPMIESALLPLDYPETSVVEEDSLYAQTLAVAADLPVRPIVLGGLRQKRCLETDERQRCVAGIWHSRCHE